MPDSYTYFPPVGIDRADGLDVRPGTLTPPDAITVRNTNGLSKDGTPYFFEEASDSPQIERAEQGTWKHWFNVDKQTGLILLGVWSRGMFVTDSAGNVFRILNTNLEYRKPDRWLFSMTCESISFDNPPDEFHIEVVEINPAIEKHPRYAFLTPTQRRIINSGFMGATFDDQNNFISVAEAMESTSWQADYWGLSKSAATKIVQQVATELIQKKLIGEETFYLPGFRVIWSRFYWGPSYLNPGGYIEDPILQGGLPFYFWSPELIDTNPANNIFSAMAAMNPQLYRNASGQTGISWLRLADTVQFQRTWHKVTRQWLGAPYAHWDGQIYTQQYNPYLPPYDPNGPQPPA